MGPTQNRAKQKSKQSLCFSWGTWGCLGSFLIAGTNTMIKAAYRREWLMRVYSFGG